ncbi:MAG: hypothetical protein NTX64_09795 [Elusimicrobia bacterium]|nr:hypothetical protein [Elusimicrobiota bacterium]
MADEEQESPEPPERSSAVIGLVMTVLLCGAAIAFFIYYEHRSEELPSQGLDMAEAPTPDPSPAAGPGGAAFGIAPAARPSNLTPIKGGPALGAPASGNPRVRAQQTLADVVRPHERFFADLTNKYIAKYPVFQQWGKEWITYPDLHQATKDYWKYHDPVRFAFQIAGSKNLGAMISKYSGHTELQAFLRDAIAGAPKDLVKAGVDYLEKDSNAVALVKRFAAAAGLPPSILAGFTGGHVDQQAVMNEIMQSNPALQGTGQNQASPFETSKK